MLKLDNNLLEELGLGSLPEDQKRAMLQHIYETLELRVGTNLANQMTDQQLEEFEKFIDEGGDANQAEALKWLETNLPNYKQVVNDVFEQLKLEIKQMAPQLVAASAGQPAMPQPTPPATPTYQDQPQYSQPQAQPYAVPPAPQQLAAPAYQMPPQPQAQAPAQDPYAMPPQPQTPTPDPIAASQQATPQPQSPQSQPGGFQPMPQGFQPAPQGFQPPEPPAQQPPHAA